ncbi:ribose-5-phosphate isomerase [Gephyromycinifex aptenodytis]|uniref:ribose-5-phosphate isomerase n=1 Tax=Gephyromycinifex aptenodytis TaxID=2716227 RepID=UPI0014477785|nr:ribose-5-phosphate isomerase [Gephyromycinifex aptenodytis]
MKIHVGADHAAYEVKNELVAYLREQGHDVTDHGPAEYDPQDDYPMFVIPAAQAVAADDMSLGLVLGGSGNGEQIAANKVAGVRAVLAYDAETAKLGREHNDARVVSIGARLTDLATAKEILDVFLTTDFTGEERHQRRIDLMSRFEATGSLTE